MPTRKTSMTMDADLLEEARRYRINVSAAAQSGVETVVKAERWRRWQDENRDDMQKLNEWVEANGLPLARQRVFAPER